MTSVCVKVFGAAILPITLSSVSVLDISKCFSDTALELIRPRLTHLSFVPLAYFYELSASIDTLLIGDKALDVFFDICLSIFSLSPNHVASFFFFFSFFFYTPTEVKSEHGSSLPPYHPSGLPVVQPSP